MVLRRYLLDEARRRDSRRIEEVISTLSFLNSSALDVRGVNLLNPTSKVRRHHYVPRRVYSILATSQGLGQRPHSYPMLSPTHPRTDLYGGLMHLPPPRHPSKSDLGHPKNLRSHPSGTRAVARSVSSVRPERNQVEPLSSPSGSHSGGLVRRGGSTMEARI